MDFNEIEKVLTEKLGAANVKADADMSEYCSFKCGGRAKLLVFCDDREMLKYALAAVKDAPHMILGNGTDVLVLDGGYDGIMLKLGRGFSGIRVDGCKMECGAAALLSTAAKEAAANSLTGFEFASGIPGSVGGGVFMNAGAYGGEIKQILKSVDVISADGAREYTADVSELALSYRHSVFTENGDVVVSASFELEKGDKAEIDARMRELADKRNSKQPLKYPSAGSFFKRPEGNFAGALIEQAGLKGLAVGGARVSELHAGFVINEGGATATDIIKLMRLIQNTVYDKSGIMLEPEVRLIGKE